MCSGECGEHGKPTQQSSQEPVRLPPSQLTWKQLPGTSFGPRGIRHLARGQSHTLLTCAPNHWTLDGLCSILSHRIPRLEGI